MPASRAILIWFALVLAVAAPLVAAAQSPLLAWREPVYIAASFAGILALGLFLVQPLLAAGYLPGLQGRAGRRVHLWTGCVILAGVMLHVGGLWLTSPPDVIDVLLFRSPTPFSVWGVIAMWALFAAALVAGLRRKLRLPPRVWRLGHAMLVTLVIFCTALHVLLIEGTLGLIVKLALSGIVLGVVLKVLADLRIPSLFRRQRR